MITPEVRAAATSLAAAALRRVQDPVTGRVRVEDYLTVLAAATGEAAIVASGVLDIETTDLPAGAPLFGDPINQVLSGNATDLATVKPDSVVGVLVRELAPAIVPLETFGSLERLYRQVAEGVGSTAWGTVALSMPADHRPSVLPLQVAFELRPAVAAAMAASGLPTTRRHVPCALALADALKQVRDAIDIALGLTLALEVVFGTAKTVPMSRRAFEAAGRGP